MKELNTFVFIVIVIAMMLVGAYAALIASDSMKENRGKDPKPTTWFAFVLINAIMGAIFEIAHPAVYAIALVILAALQLINGEGKMRRKSWNVLGIAYAILLAFSIARRFDAFGFKWPLLLWLIAALLPFIAGLIQTYRLNREEKVEKTKKAKKNKMDAFELRGHIIGWSIISALFLAIVLVAIFR